ncbi:MAG: 5-oxoprolinase subunit PxpB [Polaribacter sp.]
MDKEISFKPFGKKAILIEWKSIISDEILKDILSFKSKIENQKKVFFTDLIVGYNSLTIKYIKEIKNFEEEVKNLKSIYLSTLEKVTKRNYTWQIPVCYDVSFGIDLEEVSEKSKLTIEQIIKLHSEKLYTVFFIGFLPGFLYLGGLNKQLYFDRKPNPRLKVEKGSLAIGGKQTGVYPVDSPGGWNVIGKTPVNFFDLKNREPCFANAGDKIKFKPISLTEFHQIKKEVEQNKYQLSKTLLNG